MTEKSKDLGERKIADSQLVQSWLGNYNPTSNYAARYPPVRYKHFCYAELPRNKTEARPDDESVSVSYLGTQGSATPCGTLIIFHLPQHTTTSTPLTLFVSSPKVI